MGLKRLTFISLATFLFFLIAHTAFASETYVSLTFDDGRASQVNAGAILAAHGVSGTFYINSADLDSDPFYMSLADVYGLAAAGNEIGGHTSNHPDLTSLPESEAAEEICGDQQQLYLWGFSPISFAYPYGATNPEVQSIVSSCTARGYTVNDYISARGVGGLQCLGCNMAESMPPQNAFAIRTPSVSSGSMLLEDLKSMVTQAESTGGWLVIPFHSVCSAPGTAPIPGDANDCSSSYSVPYTVLDQFVQWLGERSSLGTTIKTVGEVMQMPTPTVIGPNLVLNPSLEFDVDADNTPDGFLLSGYGVNTFSYTRVNTGAHTGVYAEQLTVNSLESGDRKVITTFNMDNFTMFATAGKNYETSVWYKSDAPVALVAFYHDSSGWHYWSQSPQAVPSSSWSELKWRTPVMPQGADYWSFGPALDQAGTMTVDDFSAITINDGGSCENGKPSLSLSMGSIYWGSYDDYTSGILSTDYELANPGSTTAYNVQTESLLTTNGVICTTPLPLLVGHISPGDSKTFTFKYLIPTGVSKFRATITASVEDGCTNSYRY